MNSKRGRQGLDFSVMKVNDCFHFAKEIKKEKELKEIEFEVQVKVRLCEH